MASDIEPSHRPQGRWRSGQGKTASTDSALKSIKQQHAPETDHGRGHRAAASSTATATSIDVQTEHEPWKETSVVTTTADTWNRLRDKERVEGELGLSEKGGDAKLFDASEPGTLIAQGYRRIVYGDHGAYVEFEPTQIIWKNLPKVILKPSHAYYDEYHSEGGFVKLYMQKRTVENKSNPPSGGVRHNREGGYADYQVGMCYIPPESLTVAALPAHTDDCSSSRRRWKR
eukprot:TRINITY_DN12863_c0_g2_i1.p1 TRINITY_DN12863_c0_g2~~TRINITY_DN12863_c0_g2_i1.p1  ORF type:complete len:252 (+),score=41.85 TRINITY_DN12863_c0_g2_i1:68-757(+)